MTRGLSGTPVQLQSQVRWLIRALSSALEVLAQCDQFSGYEFRERVVLHDDDQREDRLTEARHPPLAGRHGESLGDSGEGDCSRTGQCSGTHVEDDRGNHQRKLIVKSEIPESPNENRAAARQVRGQLEPAISSSTGDEQRCFTPKGPSDATPGSGRRYALAGASQKSGAHAISVGPLISTRN